jgi:hypothetical protein
VAGLVAEVVVERRSPGETGRRRRVISGQPFHDAQGSQGPGLAGPVACLTRRGEGDQVEGRGLIPVTMRARKWPVAASMAMAHWCRPLAAA